MESISIYKPRAYQQAILDRTIALQEQGSNPLIELDCGLGKRFLQLALIRDCFPDQKIIVILQASTSLYETYNYLIKQAPKLDIKLIDSRMPSSRRAYTLRNNRVILTLPQTLSNTIKKDPDAVSDVEIVIINEVDQIVKRMAEGSAIKQPYPKLLPLLERAAVIGMSGTLRDSHYIFDDEQLKIQKELETLQYHLPNTSIISMNSILDSNVSDFISTSMVNGLGISDDRMMAITAELELYIEETKNQVMEVLKRENPFLHERAKTDFSALMGPLPISDRLANRFHRGYLVRKYLWAMTGEKSYHHLINYGIDKRYVQSSLPRIPGKFFAVRDLIKNFHKSVILCSYIDTVDALQALIEATGIRTVTVTGATKHADRIGNLDRFREAPDKMVAILSNVGERDLDVPQAELLVVFDLIRTTKTVYQKLKRTRGGTCKILYYAGTNEEKKVNAVLKSISIRYPWSTEILPNEVFSFESPE